MTFTPLGWFLALTLTSFRLAWMFTREEGPFGAFDRWRIYLAGKASKQYSLSWTLAELFNCPLCLGVWISGLMTLLYFLLPVIIVKFIIIWLAVAGLQSVLTLLIIKDE